MLKFDIEIDENDLEVLKEKKPELIGKIQKNHLVLFREELILLLIAIREYKTSTYFKLVNRASSVDPDFLTSFIRRANYEDMMSRLSFNNNRF